MILLSGIAPYYKCKQNVAECCTVLYGFLLVRGSVVQLRELLLHSYFGSNIVYLVRSLG